MSQSPISTKQPTHLLDLIGHTPLIRIPSLSEETGSEILLKCENLNPGGSIKDRAAKQMVLNAKSKGELKPGMTIIEGTAGNTGIGLGLVARALGHPMVTVMPKGQAGEKQRLAELYATKVILVDPVPFKDPNHFYHTARRLAEESPQTYWWANQFENLGNFQAHYQGTGPEIWEQTKGRIDWLVSAAGTGGTIAGCSRFLKEKNPNIKVRLVDPKGSGLASYLATGEFKAEGSSITEGIGIMRLVANFAKAQVDDWVSLPDQDLVKMAYHLRDRDGLLVGSSAALNIAAAFALAKEKGPGLRIVTFLCDQGERSASKLWNESFLKEKALL